MVLLACLRDAIRSHRCFRASDAPLRDIPALHVGWRTRAIAAQLFLIKVNLANLYSQSINMVLQAIKYSKGQLEILDQLKLPHAEEYDHIYSSTDAWHAIKEMRTRGAPAIAIVAALALAVELANMKLPSVAEEVKIFIIEKLDYLVTSRPTAVNLADAARKLQKVTEKAAEVQDADGDSVREAYVAAAEKMLVDDVSDNENIGRHGADWVVRNTEAGRKGKVSMITHCNTG
jgi:methylthioribose-1-phosphate isomerase